MNIGFVDYNLSNFHANKFLSILRDTYSEVADLTHAWGMQERDSRTWCEEHSVTWCHSAEEVAKSVDAAMILAPDNAEVHRSLAEAVFPSCRRVYVDKTFAQSFDDARAIFDLADLHDTIIFSTSALRFAPELTKFNESDLANEAVDLQIKGPNQWTTYGIHVVEPIVCAFGPGVKRVRAGGSDKILRVDVEWKDGRTGHLTVNSLTPQSFEMTATAPGASETVSLNDPVFYDRLFDAIIAFFQNGAPPVPAEETLVVAAILESVTRSQEQDGAWIQIAEVS